MLKTLFFVVVGLVFVSAYPPDFTDNCYLHYNTCYTCGWGNNQAGQGCSWCTLDGPFKDKCLTTDSTNEMLYCNNYKEIYTSGDCPDPGYQIGQILIWTFVAIGATLGVFGGLGILCNVHSRNQVKALYVRIV